MLTQKHEIVFVDEVEWKKLKRSGTPLLPRDHSWLPLTHNASAMEIYLKVKHYEGRVKLARRSARVWASAWTLTSLGSKSDHNMMDFKKHSLGYTGAGQRFWLVGHNGFWNLTEGPKLQQMDRVLWWATSQEKKEILWDTCLDVY